MESNQRDQTRACPHQAELREYLQKLFSIGPWEFSLPHSWGRETYTARGDGQVYFVKLGVEPARYLTMAAMGLTPPVVTTDQLEDGTTLIIQPYIDGRKPSWSDFQLYIDQFASLIGSIQRSSELMHILPTPASDSYRDLAQSDLRQLRQRWAEHKAQVPNVAGWVDDQLGRLEAQINTMDGAGAVVAHHDLCNPNWIISAMDKVYLIDLDDMAMDDPAADLGMIMWWYYPPELRPHFLHTAGYMNSDPLQTRMRLRMALHCLSIQLPRRDSFDQFEPGNFDTNLADFRAILAGQENPHGYKD